MEAVIEFKYNNGSFIVREFTIVHTHLLLLPHKWDARDSEYSEEVVRSLCEPSAVIRTNEKAQFPR